MAYFPSTFEAIDDVINNEKQDAVKELGLREGTAEFEYFIVRAELANNGNLQHGLEHAAELLKYDPERKEWLDLLEVYLEKVENPKSVFKTKDQDKYFAYEAVRAYILAKEGNITEAINILIAINNVKPDVPYISSWGIDWLSSAEAFESVNRDIYLTVLLNGLRIFGEFTNNTARYLRHLSCYNKLFEKYHEKFDADQFSLMGQAGLLRKAGQFEAAYKIAKAAHEKYGDWHSLIALGLILREDGDYTEAEDYLKKAYELAPDEGVSPFLEIADMYFNRQDWPLALEWYNRVLSVEPDNGWAHASKLYCRWKLMGQGDHPQELIIFAQQNQDNHRAYNLLNEFRPFVGGLPRPTDATANVLSQVLEQTDNIEDEEGQNKISITLSALESPSNTLAYKLAFGETFELDVTVESIPEPDPRESLGEVPYRIWRYADTEAVPALQKPPEEIAKAIHNIAAGSFENIWPTASRKAKSYTEKDINDLLAVMVHPPATPDGIHVLDWIPVVQFTALAVIANIDGPWESSEKRNALFSVLLGPRDWATEAAIVTLTRLVEDQPTLAFDIHQQFEKLQAAIPEKGACLYEYTLYYNWLTMPHLFDNEREDLRRILEGILEE